MMDANYDVVPKNDQDTEQSREKEDEKLSLFMFEGHRRWQSKVTTGDNGEVTKVQFVDPETGHIAELPPHMPSQKKKKGGHKIRQDKSKFTRPSLLARKNKRRRAKDMAKTSKKQQR